MKLRDIKFKRPRLRAPSRKEASLVLFGAVIALVCVELASLNRSSPKPVRFESAGINSPWIPDTVKHWEDPINEMAKKYDVDPNLIAIIMTLESGGYSKADSGQALGLMQITPPTASDIAKKFLDKPRENYDLLDPWTNIEFGAAYLAYLRDTFGTTEHGTDWNSTVELIAAGYNGGPGAASNLASGNGLKGTQTLSYSRDAFNMWRERNADNSPTFDRWQERGGSELIDKAKAENK